MTVSIITTVLNGKETIEETIRSVLGQTYENIEYIIVDGGSKDGTLEIVRKYKDRISCIISEPDKGNYDAMNKGLKMATGEAVGFLHADDFYAANTVIEKIVETFISKKANCLWGDLVYVKRKNPEKIIRYWKAGAYAENSFRRGWMPPHPAFFAKKWVYERYGYFNTDFKIAADYELMLRFLHKHKVSSAYYIPEVLVKMRVGGVSNKSFKDIAKKSSEDYKAWKVNGLSGGAGVIILKNISKVPQFFIRQSKKIMLRGLEK